MDKQLKEILNRLNYFYKKSDGMKFPNSAEGDILKMTYKYILSLNNKLEG